MIDALICNGFIWMRRWLCSFLAMLSSVLQQVPGTTVLVALKTVGYMG